jgi:hypothetical protein
MGNDWVGNPNLVPARNTEADAGIHVRTGFFAAPDPVRTKNSICSNSMTVARSIGGSRKSA